ncbi:MAG: ABC transporter substrate-binding protein, partial [Bacillota bacterium]
MAVLTNVAHAKKPVTIVFWHGQAGPLGELLNKLVDRFNKSQGDVVVKPEFVGDWTALNQKIMAAVSVSQPPDLAQVGEIAYTDTYLKAGVIAPVQRFMDSDPTFKEMVQKDFYAGFLRENTYAVGGRNVLVSWPFAKAITVLFYNQEMLQQAGFNRPPATWAEFREVAKALTIPGKRWGFAFTPNALRVLPAVILQNGGSLVSEDQTKALFDSPEAIGAVQLFVDLVKKDQSSYVTKGFDWQNDLVAGKVAMAANTIVSQAYIQRDIQNRFHLGVAPLPAGPKEGTLLYGPNAVIFATKSKEKQEAAWEFLKWWVEPETMTQWCRESGYIALRKSVIETMSKEDPSLKVFIESLAHAQPYPNFAKWTEVRSVLVDGYVKAVLGQATPEDAMKEAARKANSILAQP